MPEPKKDLRINGVYAQAEEGRYMLRTKVPGGVLSAEQALRLCEVSEGFANGMLHLTTRMSVELHGLQEEDLERVWAALGSVGLTSRGACGGAVRGVAVSTPFAPGAPRLRALACAIHSHFTGHAAFEGLPKKFKVGVDAGYEGSRHLIQDVGMVHAGREGAAACYDVWLAGGLGREPREAFLFEEKVPEARILPLLEVVVGVYKARTPKGKRLKHLVEQIGRETVEAMIREEWGSRGDMTAVDDRQGATTPPEDEAPPAWAEARVFAGELSTAALRQLVRLARKVSGGRLVLTPDQNVALPLAAPAHASEAQDLLAELGFGQGTPETDVTLRVCPGSHECRVGLAPTRDVARALVGSLGEGSRALTWAVSGCPNSCAQPQIADVGLVCIRLSRGKNGDRKPLFDLLRRDGTGFGRPLLRRATVEEVLQACRGMG